MFTSYKTKAALIISICSLTLGTIALGQGEHDTNSSEPSKSVRIEVKHVRQSFSFNQHGFELLPLADTTVSTITSSSHKGFDFSGPRRKDGLRSLFSFSLGITVSSATDPLPTPSEFIKDKLELFRLRFASYSEKPITVTIDDKKCEGVTFSGMTNDNFRAKGTILATKKDGALLSLLLLDVESEFDKTQKDFLKMLETCKIF